MANSVRERARETVASPGIKRALPWVSMGLVAAGIVIIGVSLFAGGEAPPPAVEQHPSAQAELKKALTAAQQYFQKKQPHSYIGFDVGTAEGLDPSLTWNKSKEAVAGEVSIRTVKKTAILLVSKDQTSGKSFCIVHSIKGIKQGKGDVSLAGDCSGGW